MAYADFDYYVNDFKGSSLDNTAFDSLSEKATDYINSVTFSRITDVNDKIKRCCCALAEQINLDNNYSNGKIVSSEKNGNYSVSYAISSNVATEHYRRMFSICLQYLGSSGLMYRGVDCDL